MILSVHASHSSTRTYVLKLNRDCESTGRIAGLLENVASGRAAHFTTAEELIAALTGDLAAMNTSQQDSGDDQ